MASPSPNSPPALQPGNAGQQADPNVRPLWSCLLTALLIALWLGGIAALADEPSELDVMRATAAAARDIEREGAFLDGSSPWDATRSELADAPAGALRVARSERMTP
jgi:hypothetical protein